MSRYLITGCAGFIGSHLSEKLLNSGHEVIGIDNLDPFYPREIKEKNLAVSLKNQSFTFFEMDIALPTSWGEINSPIDGVIHLAAKAGVRPSIENPEDYIHSNILGTQQLLSWMAKHNHKNLVFASSSSVYGNNKKIPFSETDNVDFPISPYAYTKKACEQMIYAYHYLYQINALCLRFFTVYGPRQRPDLAIHKFTRLIHQQKPIPMFGDGSTARDYTYIDDTIDGIIKSIQYVEKVGKDSIYEIINLGNNQPVELKLLIEELKKASKSDLQLLHLSMQPGDVDITYADIEKAKNLLGYHPNTTISEGLKMFMNWYESK